MIARRTISLLIALGSWAVVGRLSGEGVLHAGTGARSEDRLALPEEEDASAGVAQHAAATPIPDPGGARDTSGWGRERDRERAEALADAADEAAATIGRRLEEIRATVPDGTLRWTRARAALGEARRVLLASGCDETLASALTSGASAAGDERAPRGGEPDVPRTHALLALQSVRTRLGAFAAAARAGIDPAPGNARALLETILQDPVFAAREPAKPGVIRQFFDRLREIIMNALFSISSAVALHTRVVGGVIVLFLIAALAFCAARIVTMIRRRPARRDGAGPVQVQAPDAPAGAADLLARAAAETGAGRLDAAMRLLEKAGVLALRESGELPARPGVTDLEGIVLMREHGDPSRLDAFARLAELHDRAIYAGRGVVPAAVVEATRLAGLLVGGPSA